MACFEPDATLDLARRDNLLLHDVRGVVLRVTRGSLWVTQENDTRDIVLRTGDTWAVERNGLTIVEAQADATFCVTGPRAAAVLAVRRVRAVPAPTLGEWWRRIAGAFFAAPTPRSLPYV